ncbi:DNA polymerase III subunit beta [Imhoffiella purpurea]|uniref:Beta sliding clamp n=1 Tax=Imhoffiella purpurea TaxID=1249627 RepID=W9VC26_9GAMM|nr:DNA polymerase III subunit beta [Imhoffiella purpurea]EXJ17138.1 DNA polymerase III beta subunit [Imhoffiella purpurea]
MEFVVNRETLWPIVGKVIGVVERRQTLPILGNLLVKAQGQQVRFTGSDLEVEVSAECAADVSEEGETTVPARKLADICRSLEEGADIRFQTKNDRCVLTARRGRFALGVLPATDYPTMEIEQGGRGISLPENVLKRLLEKTAFAMAQQDVRYYLNGLLIEFQGEDMIAVATDGHRLARYKIRPGGDFGEGRQVIVPSKTVLELKRLLSNSEEMVELLVGAKSVRIAVGHTTMVSKLVDGRYPDYERVIPRSLEKTATLDKDELKGALSRTAILSNEKYRGVRLAFGDGVLRLLAHNPEQEEAEEEIESDYSGEAISIGFNVAYLMDVLNAIDAEKVQVQFQDADSSSIWRGRDSDDETYVVMPMRL